MLRKLKAPSLVLACFLLATACATAPARPPVQIGSGEPRVDPVTGEVLQPGDVDETRLGEPGFRKPARGDGGLIPPFMDSRDVKRAAVLLPFSHPNAQVRTEAESMLAGIELALFEFAGDDFLIMPKDTAGKQSVTEARVDEALQEGADIILGPLFGDNVKAVRHVANARQVPIIAFSNDRTAAGGGAYLASISPEEEVSRVMQYAGARGVRSFVFLGPGTPYGRQVEAAMRYQASLQGGAVVASSFYDATSGATQEARQIATVLISEITRGKVAVMIPERGVKLLSVAPLLPYNGVDMRQVMLMGTSLWDDPSIWREPTLEGGVYAAPDPENLAGFKQTYDRIYGRNPSGLAAVAYDAAALAVRLGAEDNIRYNGVTDPDGFMGVNGLFRFRIDGTSQRGLAVMQIQASGARVVEKGLAAFGAGPS